MTKKHVEEERAYLAYIYISLFIIEGCQDRKSNKVGTWRQELMQRPWRGAAYWFVSNDLLSLLFFFFFFFFRSQGHQPRGGTIHKEFSFPSSNGDKVCSRD
jgi:hypothetical protein